VGQRSNQYPSIMGLMWDIDKFIGSNEFGLWKVKMREILIQQKCVEALKVLREDGDE